MGKPDPSYEKKVKIARANKGEIRCSYCQYHKNENRRSRARKRR